MKRSSSVRTFGAQLLADLSAPRRWLRRLSLTRDGTLISCTLPLELTIPAHLDTPLSACPACSTLPYAIGDHVGCAPPVPSWFKGCAESDVRRHLRCDFAALKRGCGKRPTLLRPRILPE